MEGRERRAAHDRSFVGSVPEVYDRLMVPMVFAAPASSLAARVAQRNPSRILETAAGTGVLTAALVDACPGAALLATDLNQPMLDRAATRVSGPTLRFQQADALRLPVDEATYDIVVSQFGVMFFPDRVAGHREARRVLRPGGAWVFNTWDSLEANDFARVVTQAVQDLAGDGSFDFMDRVPHGYHQEDRIRDDLTRAGFDVVSLEPVEGESVATADDAAVALCHGTPLRGIVEAHPRVTLEEATRAAGDALRTEYGDGEIRGRTRWLEVVAEPNVRSAMTSTPREPDQDPQHDQDADPPTPDGQEPDTTQLDPDRAEPASDPDPEPGGA